MVTVERERQQLENRLKVLLLCLFLAAACILYLNKSNKSNKMNLRIGYEYQEAIENLDPANIKTIYQSNLIENFYSRILEYSTEGNLICVLCNKFWIEENIIYFEFKDNLQTIDGFKITAKDAESSLKRLIKLSTNTHGNLKNFIDTKSEHSISSTKNVLQIKLIKAHYSQFFLPLLTSMDFSIVPEKSLNNAFIDYRNTSGPYYLDTKDNSKLVLLANPYHPLYSDEMFKRLEIVSIDYGDGVDAFLRNDIDVLDITYYPGLPQYEKLFNQTNKKFTYAKTALMNVFLLNFSSDSAKKFSSEELFRAAGIISKVCLSFKKYGYGFQEVFEFVQSNGSGHLNHVQMNEIKKMRLKTESFKNNRPVVLGVHEASYEKMKEAFVMHPEIEVKSYPRNPLSYSRKERPDVFLQTTDSSFNEDISLLSYNFSMEFFGFTREKGEQWINEFIEISDKETRIKKLQDFQFNLLKTPIIYPIGASPYWAIANEDLDLNFSENFPGSTWWKIRKK